MQARLYPKADKPKDPLRLAEEFKALLGESALEGLIRDLVRDEEWLPGDLHKRLVRLPWTDILTTNWDTLLERAALENLGQTYETVRCIGDIATTRGPRVVKLHGSLPSNRPFILSEEDYRTYPRVFAPFVNLVQQTLLENELCLVGFSGDDPNFLEWSGWVRDQLGASARRIHLVGALDLSPAERRLLESRNISAIDLTPLLESDDKSKHRTAGAAFLDYLERSKPQAEWEWPKRHLSPPSQAALRGDKAETLALSMNLAQSWASERGLYPGWVVCPPQVLRTAKSETISSLFTVKSIIAELPPKDRGRLVFEATWRHDTFFISVQDWLKAFFRDTILNDECWYENGTRQFVASVLLRTAREERDQQAFEEWQRYLELQRTLEPEIAASLLYQRCLWARDELNFQELKELLVGLEGPDPLWKLRRAALLCDLGDVKSARETVHAGLRQIREHFYRDRDSVWTISRLAWAQFLLGGLRSWSDLGKEDPVDESEVLRLRFFETKVDPWETLQAIDIKIEEDLRRIAERNKTIEPLFDAGAYRIHSRIEGGTWWPTESIYDIGRTSEVAGIPARTDSSIIMATRMERAEALTGYKLQDDADYLRTLRIAQADTSSLVDTLFGRVRVAVLPGDRCSMLRELLIRALDYSLAQLARREGFGDDFWSRRCGVYCEILSRLSLRLSGPDANALFHKALLFASEARWKSMELHEPLKHLLERSFSAIPPRDRCALITEIVNFPLPMEAGIANQEVSNWPEAASWLFGFSFARPDPDDNFRARISQLIERVANADSDNRNRAVLRLTNLYMAGTLNTSEADRFGVALWSRRKSEMDLPSDTTLYSHMFLFLPSPDHEVARALFKSRDHEPSSGEYLIALAGAARKQENGIRELTLTKEEALTKLQGILAWHPPKEPEIDFANVRGRNRIARQAIGSALADAIFHFLSAGDLTAELIDQYFTVIESEVAVSAAQALPELMRIEPSVLERATEVILRMMFSSNEDKNSAGFHAIYRWVVMFKDGAIPQPPPRLVECVVYMVEARRKPGMRLALILCKKLLDNGMLTQTDCERLIRALDLIIIETDYATRQLDEPESNTITLVRADAVRLASALGSLNASDERLIALLAAARRDPMPEVRFATEFHGD
jgi:hypothetical protein